MEKTALPYLPHDLIIQILQRLPVKSLICFKCVSKSWFSLISNNHFANSHFQLTAATHNRRIVLISIPSLETRSIDLEASLNDDSPSLNLSFMHPAYFFSHKIISSCRGFIVLKCFSSLYLWNPSTGIRKQIPVSPYFNPYAHDFYGFGYDQSTDDYLLVSLSYTSKILDDSSPHLEFYSLRADTWKEIEGTYFPYVNVSDRIEGYLVNGVIHWLAFRHDISMTVIVAFDLTEMKLLDMSSPHDCNREPNYCCGLWAFGEFLSLWAMGRGTVEIWVMKEYKVHSSWTKTLILSVDGISTRYFFPICSTKSGDIIGRDGGTGLVKYDNKGKLLEHRSYFKDDRVSRVAIYTESLLSLPTDHMQD